MSAAAGALAGRAALVTGSGRGLGRAYARALAELGCAVMVNSPARADGASALQVADEIRAAGGTAEAHAGSVAEEAGARAAVDDTIDRFGRIDILVVNAGVILNKPFLETNSQDLADMVAVHFAGPFAATQRALPAMLERGWGRIVLTGTGSAAFGLENQSAYASAKAAIVGLCNVLKLETAGADICVNVVLPVAPPLGRTPASLRIAELFGEHAGRLDPEWVAPLVCLLASDACPGSGGVYSAVAGRYARVFTAITPGWQAEGDTPPALDQIAANLDSILSKDGYDIPNSILHEIEIAAMRAGGR